MTRMNRADIREMCMGGESATDCLRAVVHSGVEYPDAVWLVTDALRMKPDEVDAMEIDYLEQV